MESMLAPADTIARTLSGFVSRMRLDQVPAAVSLRARHLMLDAIGCGLAARKEAVRFSLTPPLRMHCPKDKAIVQWSDSREGCRSATRRC